MKEMPPLSQELTQAFLQMQKECIKFRLEGDEDFKKYVESPDHKDGLPHLRKL